MPNIINTTGKAGSIPKGLMAAAGVSMALTLLLSAVIANAIHVQKITWEQAGYWIMGLLFICAFAGGKCAYAIIKRQRLAIAIMSGILYWAVLLCITGLLFGGSYGAVLETAGMILAGSFVSTVLFPSAAKKQRGRSTRHIVKITKKRP